MNRSWRSLSPPPGPEAKRVRFDSRPDEFRLYSREYSLTPSLNDGHSVRSQGHEGNVGEDSEKGESELPHETSEGEERKDEVSKVLAIHSPFGIHLAAAFYDSEEGKVTVMEDSKDTQGWDLVELLLEQLQPDQLVIPSRTCEGIRDRLDEYMQINTDIKLNMQAQKAFSVDNAIYHMGNLDLPQLLSHQQNGPSGRQWESQSDSAGSEIERIEDTLGGLSASENYAGMGKTRMTLVKMGNLVNVDAQFAMSALGGLLNYLSRRKGRASREALPRITRLESMSLERHMLINRDALRSLAIIDFDTPEQIANRTTPEHLTLYELLNHCGTAMGKRLLYNWCLRPLVNLDDIAVRHDAVGVFAGQAQNLEASSEDVESLADDMRKTMKSIRNIRQHLAKIKKGNATIVEWKAITESIVAASKVKQLVLMVPRAVDLPVVRTYCERFTAELEQVVENCALNIDWDESKDEGRIVVRAGVDPDIDEWRQVQGTIDDNLNEMTERLSKELDKRFYRSLGCQQWPQFGFLVWVITRGDGHPAPDDFKPMFSNDGRLYFKTDHMRRLDDFFGDIDQAIKDRENNIIQSLAEKILDHEGQIEALLEVIGELDCCLALARAVNLHGLIRPQMRSEPILEIREGRHLLHEKYVDQYIRNDTLLEGGEGESGANSMMILTGANGSGKSAYGKQVALIVFMAQIGCFVPATSAVIGVVDKIFTRLQTIESSSKPASAFMIDLSQVSLALRGATSRSLIILDEFGKGTLPVDGAALLAGVIEYLVNGACPRTVVLTHFHELFGQKIIGEDLPITFCYMKTEIVEGTKEFEYMFKLVPGRCLTSQAAQCALALGVPRRIVKKAHEVTELLANFELHKLWETEPTPEEQLKYEKAENLAKIFLDWKIDPETTDVAHVLRNIVEATVGLDDEEENEENNCDKIVEMQDQEEDWDRDHARHETNESQRFNNKDENSDIPEFEAENTHVQIWPPQGARGREYANGYSSD